MMLRGMHECVALLSRNVEALKSLRREVRENTLISSLKKGQLERGKRVNLSAPRPEGRGLLEVHPEPGSSTPP
jgi:hypothetical protein